MIIDCISDLHGFHPQLEGGDLLIIAGDLTGRDQPAQHLLFYSWLHKQNYKKFVIVAGNHDKLVQKGETIIDHLDQASYLQDSGAEFEGLKIWGMPWTPWFDGVNPHCNAFMLKSKKDMAKKVALIPHDTDILVTHGPPFGILDRSSNKYRCGCPVLEEAVANVAPKLHVFGHIHEGYGQEKLGDTLFVNCAYVNYKYQPVNKPIRIIL